MESLLLALGQDISMKELAYKIKEVVGYQGDLMFDVSKPEGMPRKLLDVSKANAMGWQAKVDLDNGIKKTYAWFSKS